MDPAISKGFKDEAEYRKVTGYLIRYTRLKLIAENIWDFQVCTERATDMVTDAVVGYLNNTGPRGNQGVYYKIGYMRKSIDNVLISKKFIKEKKNARQITIEIDSDNESIEKISYSKWEQDTKIKDSTEKDSDYYKRFFNLDLTNNSKFSTLELKVIDLKNQGMRNKKVAEQLNLSEGYVSKLVKKLRPIVENNWS